MRVARVTVATVAAATLSVASIFGVAAQSPEPDPMAPAVVTGTDTALTFSGPPALSDGSVWRRESVQSTSRWEASDPRLSGEATYAGNWHRYTQDGFQVEANSRVLVNDGGRWVSQATALAIWERGTNIDTVVLTGEGGYEGLTAYLLMDYETEPATFVGVIFPGQMPMSPAVPPAE